MIHTDLSLLVPELENKAQDALDEMNQDAKLKELGVSRVVTSETLRDVSTQMAYYSRGRMIVSDVRAMYKAAGLWSITDKEATQSNTWTLESKHLLGEAVDLVPLKDGKTWWSAPKEVWTRMGEIGEAHGLTWGGRWKNTDCPHFEI